MGSALVQVCQREAASSDGGCTGNQSRNASWRKNSAHLLPEAKNSPVYGVCFFRLQLHPLLLLTWFPSYLVEERGLSVESMSVITVIPWILGFIGLAAGDLFLTMCTKKQHERCAVLAQGCACLMFVFISGPDWFGRACDNYCKRCYTCRFISVLSLFDRRYLLGCHSRCG